MHSETRLVSIESDMAHKDVEACFISCFDPRFPSARAAAQKEAYAKIADLIQLAGGGKVFAGAFEDAVVQYMLEQVATSIRLHHPSRVLITFHADCGAYGGSQGKSEEEEFVFFKREFTAAASNMRTYGITIPIGGIFLHSRGADWIARP